MSSPMIRSGECRKFSPNIFNKTKCTNCFRQKEEHTAEALESNRATRKIAKCGYLFVAPGWDFTNPVNRTKRWQRRWFVLYDDGELSYSLDEHPETVPQASIDMNKVMEVTNGEEVTGNSFSLAITAPDHVHFVKGTSREEIRLWSDVLSVFPRSKGRHKRNATFPGTQPTPKSAHILQSSNITNKSTELRNQYNTRLSCWDSDNDVYPTKDTTSPLSPPPQASPDSRKVYPGSPPTRDKIESRSRRIGGREKRAMRSFSQDISKMVPPTSWQSPTPQGHPEMSRRLLMEEYESECKLKDIADSITRPRSNRSPTQIEPTRDSDPHKQIRGDPDGCGLDISCLRYSPSDLRVDLPSEELLNIKKGWLMKQGQEKEWTKHWFVLRGNALLYYRDPSAEDQGILDGVIDLSGVTSVSEIQVQRNYGFQTTTWDERRYILSAVTCGIRHNWMSAIKKAAALQDSNQELSSPIQETNETVVCSTPLTGRSLLFSSDEEYRTASENGRRESGEWGEALPPSPPLNRTPMSRVKERARGVSKLKVYGSKRSRSSPPTSRRSTLDSVSSQDVMAALAPPPPTDQKTSELENVRQELTLRLRELSNAQEELLRQKQRQADIALLEKQVEELSKRAEETGKQRARDAAELEALKKRFVEEKVAWERAARAVKVELEETSGRCSGLCAELAVSRDTGDSLASRLQELEVRLEAAARENDALYARIQEMNKPALAPTRSRSLDSLSDLTNLELDIEDIHQLDNHRLIDEYIDMRGRFEKAISEIRAMKRELRESHAQIDWLELSVVSSRQEINSKEQQFEASNNLMAARIQDLACKLSLAEKQIRTLKQKLSKTETRDKRRSLSLKGRESFTLSKEFEDKLVELEKKVNSMDLKNEATVSDKKVDKLAARIRRKSLDSATSSEPLKVLLRLNSLEAKITSAGGDTSTKQATELKLFSGDDDQVDGQPQTEMVCEVKKMENLLRAKLVVLSKKRESLISSGQWNNQAQLNLLAEKLAYESVLVGRLHDAIVENRGFDAADAQRLMDSLDQKLAGGKTHLETSLDYLVKALAKHLSRQTVRRVNRKVKEKKKRDTAITELLDKKLEMDTKVSNYIDKTVSELADLLALESLADDGGLVGEDYSRVAWSMAQEAVNQELIQEEIVQVMSQCSHTYQRYIESENQTRFVSVVKDRANLELWASSATQTLKVNMDDAMGKLQTEYKRRLEHYKSLVPSPRKTLESEEKKARELMLTFADIVAHKSLLDARISVISGDDVTDSEQESQGALEENSLLSEIQYLYVKFCQNLSQDSKDGEKLKELVNRINNEIIWLEQYLVPVENTLITRSDNGESGSDSWMEAVSKKFEVMKERILNIQRFAKDSKEECAKCVHLKQELSRIENEYSTKINEIEKRQEEEMIKLKNDYDSQVEIMMRKHEEEAKLLLKSTNKSGNENSSKEVAQEGYLNPLSDLEQDENDDLHLRYKKEIQHLRAVCEKGLIGMENGHRRQVEELQQKHEREMEALRLEKDQALAEETHATLAALDAMRKAHEADVQREIAKFKSEFLGRMQTNHDLSAIHRQHQEEMSEIKQEILSLSEKYSVKCVENTSLEDKLRSATQQLAHAHQHILQLDSRYKHLVAKFTAEANVDTTPISRLHEHSHGVIARSPRVVHCIPKLIKASTGCQTDSKSSVRKKEPSLLSNAEVIRSPPEKFTLCGMVSKRRAEFERRLTAPAACHVKTSRVTFI